MRSFLAARLVFLSARPPLRLDLPQDGQDFIPGVVCDLLDTGFVVDVQVVAQGPRDVMGVREVQERQNVLCQPELFEEHGVAIVGGGGGCHHRQLTLAMTLAMTLNIAKNYPNTSDFLRDK